MIAQYYKEDVKKRGEKIGGEGREKIGGEGREKREDRGRGRREDRGRGRREDRGRGRREDRGRGKREDRGRGAVQSLLRQEDYYYVCVCVCVCVSCPNQSLQAFLLPLLGPHVPDDGQIYRVGCTLSSTHVQHAMQDHMIDMFPIMRYIH